MAETLELNVITIDGEVFKQDVQYFKCFSSTGELGVYPEHTNAVISLNDTDVQFDKADQSTGAFFVSDGILKIRDGKASIITDTYIEPSDIDSEKEQQIVQASTKSYKEATNHTDQVKYRTQLLQSEAKLRAKS